MLNSIRVTRSLSVVQRLSASRRGPLWEVQCTAINEGNKN